MYRLFEEKLKYWKENQINKPLMVIGVRQIGKTYTISEFAKKNFEEFIYINLEKEEIRKIFDNTINEKEIIKRIELYLERKIDIENTIIFFDEVQVSENFIVSLKYFCESEKQYKIVCAGSLLGVKVNRFTNSFPVGKVVIENMYPMNFEEFMIATKNEMLLDEIRKCYSEMKPMVTFAHDKCIELYRQYICVGGMPEAINNFIENDKDILRYSSSLILNIAQMYNYDMKKYVKGNIETVKIEKVYNNIPIQLAKDKKRFIYAEIEENGRKRKFESPIEWLVSAGMIYIANKVKKIEIPLKLYKEDEFFKLYLSDVGILVAVSGINYIDIMLDKSFEFKGAITENYIAQELITKTNNLYYWTQGRNLEIDFLLYNNDGIIPVEVKSGTNVKSTSLNTYIKEKKPSYSVRISTRNFGFENNIKSIPLYAVFCI